MKLALLAILSAAALRGPAILTLCKSGCNFADPQKAIDALVTGDVLEARAGETFTTSTNFILHNRLANWATIRSSRHAELPVGRRVFPYDAAKMPRFCSTASLFSPVVSTATTARYWKLIGLEITLCAPGQFNGGDLIKLGNSDNETRRDLLTNHVIIDRCYIHGYPYDSGPRRGILHNANEVVISNNYVDEIHSPAIESHGIGAWSAASGLIVRNNFISASSIPSLTGGAISRVDAMANYSNLRYLGNHFYKRATYVTYDFDHDPVGASLPESPAPVNGQTFVDLDGPDDVQGTADDGALYIRSNANTWLPVSRVAGDPACDENRIWRNMAKDTRWVCNQGAWVLHSGPDPMQTPMLSKSITEGATTTVVVDGASPGNNRSNYTCSDWFPVPTCTAGQTLGMYVTITGGTGDCEGINGRWRITYQSSTSFSIPYNSAGQACPDKLTLQAQFRWYPNKNLWELKIADGAYVEGNIMEGSAGPTFQNQRGACMLLNWIPQQDGDDATLKDVTIVNNWCKNTMTGLAIGSIQWDNLVTESQITPGNPTTINPEWTCPQITGNTFAVFVEQATGAWAKLNGQWVATDTGSPTCTIPFDSTGLDKTGQQFRMYDSTWIKPNIWPKNIHIVNNLFEVGSPQTMTDTGRYHSTSVSSGHWYTYVVGRGLQFGWPGKIIHNTIIKRGHGLETWMPNDIEASPPDVLADNGQPAKARGYQDITIQDNLWDGSGGTFTSSMSTGHQCDDVVDQIWQPASAGRSLTFAGNAGNLAGVWSRTLYTTSWDSAPCSTWGQRLWAREGTSTPATLNSIVVSTAACSDGHASTNTRMRLSWGSAARLFPHTFFRLAGWTPDGINGTWQVPAAAKESSNSWDVCVPDTVAPGTAKGGTWSSAMEFVDYAGGRVDMAGYGLAPASPVKGYATDGSDPGANLAAIKSATATAVSGYPNPYLDTYITRLIYSGGTAVEICYTAYNATPATITISPTRAFLADVGVDTVTQSGRAGCIQTTGLAPGTKYHVRLETAGHMRDITADGNPAVFTTRP